MSKENVNTPQANQVDQLEKFGYEQELKRVLPLGSLVFYGLAFICLFTAFGGYGVVNQVSHGMIAASYIIAAIAMTLTALSYCFMSEVYPLSGSVYSYVSRTMTPTIGFLSGWAILLDYMIVPMINYLLAAIFLTVYIPVPFWLVIIILIIFVTVINHLGIQVAAWTNNTIVIVQLVFVIALMLFFIKFLTGGGGAGTVFSLLPFNNTAELSKESVGFGVIFAGAAILTMNYAGFDAISTIAEEAKDATQIKKAILITVIGVSVYFIIVSYMLTLSMPEGWSLENPDTVAQTIIVKVGGEIMGLLFTAIYVVATTASAIAAQASASRVLYAMGRDQILPKKIFGYIHPKRKTPTYNIIFIGILSLTGIVVPLDLSFSILSFGALVGFIFVNLSVIVHFFIKGKKRSFGGFIKYILVPIGGGGICLMNFLNLSNNAFIVGGIWVGIGFIYLAISTKFFTQDVKKLEL